MILPPKLKRGAVIGIISPASPQRDPRRLDRGIAYLEGLGYRVVPGTHVRSSYGGYLAGTDAERLADLHAMFNDPRIDAIMCARGGYGTARLLRSVNYRLIARNPKVFVGFSDTTALQLAIYRRTGLVTYMGAMPSVDMADSFDAGSEEQFWKVLTSTRGKGVVQQAEPMHIIKHGTTSGTFFGVNLSVFTTLLGTPYMPPLQGSILAIEDIGEEAYRVDRMLMHIENAGVMRRLGGLVAGHFTPSAQRGTSTPDRPIADILRERSEVVSGPVVSGLMFGHEARKLTLPIGVPARLTAGKHVRLTIL